MTPESLALRWQVRGSPDLLGGVPLKDLEEVGRLGAGPSLPSSEGPSQHLPVVLEGQKRPETGSSRSPGGKRGHHVTSDVFLPFSHVERVCPLTPVLITPTHPARGPAGGVERRWPGSGPQNR